MSSLFEIRDPDTGAVIERMERKDFPPAARQAMAEVIQGSSSAVKSCSLANGTRRASPFTGASSTRGIAIRAMKTDPTGAIRLVANRRSSTRRA
jgi:hypothetical protein